jgi:hypothetical protein
MLGVMKCFSSIGALIMLIVGLTLSGITIYAFINQDAFYTDSDTKHLILNGMIIGCVVIVLIAVLGIIGIARKNCCLIFLYQIFVIIFLALFVAFGVGTIILPDQIFQGTCNDSSNQLINVGYKAYDLANSSFCHTGCGCAMTNTSLNKYSQ